MKELHNHIFSNTTCISKENMLKYINHQLSKKELHEVEKHLLECEFCSEAVEGLKYAENASVLFAIDHQIDQRVKGSSQSMYRGLMVAASIMIIVFGSYFTFNFFDEAAKNQDNLAIQESLKMEDNAPEEESIIPMIVEEKSEDEVAEAEAMEDRDVLRKENVQQPPVPVMSEDVLADEIIVMDDIEEAEIVMDAEMIEEELLFEVMEDEVGEWAEPEMTTLSNNNNEGKLAKSAERAMTESKSESVAKSDAKDNVSKAKNKSSKKRYKAVTNKPAAATTTAAGNAAPKYYENSIGQNTIYVNDLRVVDYSQEYQFGYDLKQSIEENNISSDFASEADKDQSEKELEESTVEVTYKGILESATKNYIREEFNEAIIQFNLILKEHPEDVNAHFYTAMSYYRLDNFNQAIKFFDNTMANTSRSFLEDSEWYKALSLVALNNSDEAKTQLDKIVKEGGVYKARAKEKLKELK